MLVDADHISDERHGTLCTHTKHVNYAPDRVLRKGSRVTVAVVCDDRDELYHVAELCCLHCPMSVDMPETVINYSEYDAETIILAEATLAPDDKSERVKITEPHIRAATTTIPEM